MKRHVFVPVLIAFVAAAFIAVSILVYFTRGRPSLVRKKLKIGATLIYLTGLVSCDLIGGGTHTCYVPLPPPNVFHIVEPNLTRDRIDIDLSSSNIIRGIIERREGDEFSYRVLDGSSEELQCDDITALDGVFDEYTEDFEVAIRKDLETGSYFIQFFDVAAAEQTTGPGFRASYLLDIIN